MTETQTLYNETARRIVVCSDVNSPGDGDLVQVTEYDQLARPSRSAIREDSTCSAAAAAAGILTDTLYASVSGVNYQAVSNPYKTGSEPTAGWTRTATDRMGRVIIVQHFDGSAMPAPWGSNSTVSGTTTTSYNASLSPLKVTRTVTEDAVPAVTRTLAVDALGRLTEVTEAGSATTTYDYTRLGDLAHVYQGSQTRTFAYNTLRRLTSAQNPESGTITYAYDNNGNLTGNTGDAGEVSRAPESIFFVSPDRIPASPISSQPQPKLTDQDRLRASASHSPDRSQRFQHPQVPNK